MKKTFFLPLALILFTFSACKVGPVGSDNSTGTTVTTAGPTKSFNSTWTFTGQQWSVNLGGMNQGGSPVSGRWAFVDSSYCDCAFTFTQTAGSGDVTSGTMSTSSCTTFGPGSSMQASFCPYLNNKTGTYNHNGVALEMNLGNNQLKAYQ